MSREVVEKCINLGLVLGFAALAVGILLWLSELSRMFGLGLAALLVAGGFVLLVLAILAAKIVTMVD